MKKNLKYLKCFENWSSTRTKYLSETQDINNVNKFIEEHNLSQLILQIWEYGKKQFNRFPIINSKNEMEYTSNDACKLLININNDDAHIRKIKLSKYGHPHEQWGENELYKGRFSYETFNILMDHDGDKKLKKTIPLNTNTNVAA